MGYKSKDLVQIKSFQWYEDQEKDENGNFIDSGFILKPSLAKEICGMIGEVIDIGPQCDGLYYILFPNKKVWVYENWIKNEI